MTTPTATVVGPGFAAEVEGFDVRGAIAAGTAAGLVDLLHRHQVLVLRDQDLTPAELVAFVRLVGEPQYHVLDQFLLKEQPEIYVLSNIVEDGRPIGNASEGITWHTDLSSRERPTAYTFLYGLEVPRAGGDTWFASTYLSYEALPEERRRALDPLKVVHSYERLYAARRAKLAAEGKDPYADLTDRQREQATSAVHPMVRTHPSTGRRGLYLGTMAIERVVGMEQEEGLRLVEELLEHSISPPFRYDHRWRPKDVVVWDNRGLLHSASPYDKERERRLVYRLSIEGERPV
jgi:taurine dioxygenase